MRSRRKDIGSPSQNLKVFKPDTTVFEMLHAWALYTSACKTDHIRVLLINDRAFPADYIRYHLHRFMYMEPENPTAVPDNTTYEELLGKRVAKYGSFFRIPEDRHFFDLYLRLEEDEPTKPMLVIKPKALLKEWQLDDAVKKMNKQIQEGNVVLVPTYLEVISSNLGGSGIQVYEGNAFIQGGL